MGIRDDILRLGLNTVGVIGETAANWAGTALSKSGGDSSDSTLGASDEDTTSSNPVPTEKATDDPKFLAWDPYSIVEQLGYKNKPSPITYATLKSICYKMPVIQAIIQTRVDQVASFATPQKDRYSLGFRVKLRDSEREPTKQDKLWIQQAESLIMRTGVTDNPRGRDNFETFLRKITTDSLRYDQFCTEIVPNRKGTPAEWYAVDATTIRLADSASTTVDEDDLSAIRYVQIYDGMIIAEYTQEEMYFGVRNPNTDIRLQGYGTSEIETLIPAITNLLYAFAWNQNVFQNGTAAKGIINFKGVTNEKRMQDFRRQWYTQISGVKSAWKTPITSSEQGLEYINMQTSARDMEFSAWLDFQIKLSCAHYNMDPAELNFTYGNMGQKSSIGGTDNNKEKITESKERGLRPLLRSIANCMNQSIIWPMNESFEFEFVGLDAYTREDMIKNNQIRVKTTRTIDELRAEDDLEPLPDGKGEIILDPTWLQYAQMKEGGGEGLPGEEGESPAEGEEPEENNGDDLDYEKILAQYEAESEDEDDDTDDEKVKKSQSRSWEWKL